MTDCLRFQQGSGTGTVNNKGIIFPGSDGNSHATCRLVYHSTPRTTLFNTLVYDKTAICVRGGLFDNRCFFLTAFFFVYYFILGRVDL